jgi:hypothetical protein
VGDFAGAVLADSIIGVVIVADCMAFVDTVSRCWDCGGGVSCAYKNYSIPASKDTRPSREEVGRKRQTTEDGGQRTISIYDLLLTIYYFE